MSGLLEPALEPLGFVGVPWFPPELSPPEPAAPPVCECMDRRLSAKSEKVSRLSRPINRHHVGALIGYLHNSIFTSLENYPLLLTLEQCGGYRSLVGPHNRAICSDLMQTFRCILKKSSSSASRRRRSFSKACRLTTSASRALVFRCKAARTSAISPSGDVLETEEVAVRSMQGCPTRPVGTPLQNRTSLWNDLYTSYLLTRD